MAALDCFGKWENVRESFVTALWFEYVRHDKRSKAIYIVNIY